MLLAAGCASALWRLGMLALGGRPSPSEAALLYRLHQMELETAVNDLTWELGTTLRSSERAEHVLTTEPTL